MIYQNLFLLIYQHFFSDLKQIGIDLVAHAVHIQSKEFRLFVDHEKSRPEKN